NSEITSEFLLCKFAFINCIWYHMICKNITKVIQNGSTLADGERIAILSFHSGEDRLVLLSSVGL
ncbi:MAG: hypothetical protein MUO60_07920, partial [Clostridiaceae bacterium]|nr:hypothetical protein [Clostridiaceae bacterium]